MAYWLFKSEPGAWSWDDQVKRGAKGEEWDGVRNHTAKLNMLAMKPGDLGFFYHSVDEKQIVGIVKVVSDPHPDSTDETGTWFCVNVAADTPLPHPVSLAEIKEEPRLSEMALVKQSRLSVQPVTEKEWETICKMAAVKKATKTASKPAAKAPAKTATKTAAKPKTATKTAAKPAAKTATKTASKTAAKAPAKTAAAKKPAASKTTSASKPAAKKPAAKKPAAKSAKK